jgi:metallo-beta-lactamase family protein
MEMKIQFFGAVRTTTGSMHMVSAGNQRVLLDCGLYQGKRKEAFERNRNLPFDPGTLHACVLSHAHIDHSGNLPTLVRRGYRGPVHATPATIDLSEIMLRDSAHLQVQDVEYVNQERRRLHKNPFEPLYEQPDVDRLMKQFVPLAYETAGEIVPGVTITFHDAGHILGSALTEIHVRENGSAQSVLFTGDLGRKGMPILRDPVAVSGADTLITESTYGNRVHDAKENVTERLKALINEVAARRSKLIIPSFAVGRTQQLLYFLEDLYARRQVSDLPVYVDSPLSTRATEVYEHHPECYDQETLDRLRTSQSPFSFSKLHRVSDVEDSKALNHLSGPLVIIAPSGMCEGGRILHHLKHGIEDSRNIILFVGYQAENTLGRYLVEGRRDVRILGEEHRVSARIERLEALSGHADCNELIDYFRSMAASIRQAYVVHGELDGSEALAVELRKLAIPRVEIPFPAEEVTL